METTKIIKTAKALNWVEIAITLIMFAMFKILNGAASTVKTLEGFNQIVAIEKAGLWVMGIASVVVIVMTAILFKKSEGRVKGLGCLLAAGITTLIFSILGLTLGIIIWILCGISLKTLKQKDAEDTFEAKLQVEITSDDETTDSAEAVVSEAAAVSEAAVSTTEENTQM